MQTTILHWILFAVIAVSMLGANGLYSWLIEKTRLYRPELDIEARTARMFWEKESASKIAFSTMYLFFYAVVIAPIFEELIFREWFFADFYFKYGFWISAIISGGIWAVLHIWYSIPIIWPMGILFAYVWLAYGVVWAIILHAINNTVSVFWSVYAESKRISEKGNATIISFRRGNP